MTRPLIADSNAVEMLVNSLKIDSEDFYVQSSRLETLYSFAQYGLFSWLRSILYSLRLITLVP